MVLLKCDNEAIGKKGIFLNNPAHLNFQRANLLVERELNEQKKHQIIQKKMDKEKRPNELHPSHHRVFFFI